MVIVCKLQDTPGRSFVQMQYPFDIYMTPMMEVVRVSINDNTLSTIITVARTIRTSSQGSKFFIPTIFEVALRSWAGQ